MSLMNSLFDLVFDTDTSHDDSSISSTGCDSTQMDAINPANGLPMVGGEGGLDVAGNLYGCDSSHDSLGSSFDDGMGGGFDSSSIGGGFDD